LGGELFPPYFYGTIVTVHTIVALKVFDVQTLVFLHITSFLTAGRVDDDGPFQRFTTVIFRHDLIYQRLKSSDARTAISHKDGFSLENGQSVIIHSLPVTV
jgi:hypothetical protein